MAENRRNIRNGRKILFIGGPEAGNVRIIPEADGDYVKADNDWLYRIWPMRMPGDKRTVYFAYAEDQHPLHMLIDLWREYSPAAQIQRDTGNPLTYSKLGKQSK